jgi:hypothetical protein
LYVAPKRDLYVQNKKFFGKATYPIMMGGSIGCNREQHLFETGSELPVLVDFSCLRVDRSRVVRMRMPLTLNPLFEWWAEWRTKGE